MRGRGSRRLRASVLTVVLGLLSVFLLAPTASATDPGLLDPCHYRSGFGGSYYCLVSIEDVTSTRFGTGKRVYLAEATVSAVTPNTLTVAQLRNDCPPPTPGHFCGASLYYVYLTVPWSGTHRPTYGTVIRLYGTTTSGTMTPTGYVKTGFCPIDYC